MTWPFENDTHKVEKKLATQSLSANKQRNFLAGIIMFIASLLLAFSTILLCNATIDTQIISRVDNTQEILSVILGIAIVLLLTAGIAIKNIMYISILQRTREFAQLRTVGATYRQIKAVIHNERKQLSWKYILGGLLLGFLCNGVQREHNKKLNNGLPILHKVPPKRDYGRYFCIMAEKGGTSHGGLTEKLSPFFHAKKQEVNAYGR